MDQLLSVVVPLWQPLLLLLAANGAPVLARLLFGSRLNAALDGGLRFIDDRPLLGPTKSWRGLIAAVLLTTLTALLMGVAGWLGALLGLLAITGDALASFIKRRLAIPPQGRAVGLDQIPEALLPLALLHQALGLELMQALVVTALFMLLEMALSPLLYRLHIRLRPY